MPVMVVLLVQPATLPVMLVEHAASAGDGTPPISAPPAIETMDVVVKSARRHAARAGTDGLDATERTVPACKTDPPSCGWLP